MRNNIQTPSFYQIKVMRDSALELVYIGNNCYLCSPIRASRPQRRAARDRKENLKCITRNHLTQRNS